MKNRTLAYIFIAFQIIKNVCVWHTHINTAYAQEHMNTHTHKPTYSRTNIVFKLKYYHTLKNKYGQMQTNKNTKLY